MVIITIRSISCSCEFRNVVDNNVYVIFAILKWKFQKQTPVALSKWIIKLFSYEIRPSGKPYKDKNSVTKINFYHESLVNKMMHLSIIQRLFIEICAAAPENWYS